MSSLPSRASAAPSAATTLVVVRPATTSCSCGSLSGIIVLSLQSKRLLLSSLRTSLELQAAVVIVAVVSASTASFVVVVIVVLETAAAMGALLLLLLLLHTVGITHVMTIAAALVEMVVVVPHAIGLCMSTIPTMLLLWVVLVLVLIVVVVRISSTISASTALVVPSSRATLVRIGVCLVGRA